MDSQNLRVKRNGSDWSGGMAGRGALIFLLGFSLLAGGIVLVEWYSRFARYHWEMQLINLPPPLPSEAVAPGPDFTTNVFPASRGGDLTSLIGLPRFAQPYMEERKPGLTIKDTLGFVNRPYDALATPDVVVVGDSFMTVGSLENTFASQLADRSGLFVYNRALLGHGPFVSLENYLDDPRHINKPPRFLVWGFAEREISPKTFLRLYHAMTWRDEITRDGEIELDRLQAGRNVYVHWKSLSPAQLKSSLPATSLFTQTAQWIWNRTSCLLFGRLHPDLIPASTDVLDGPMLFYRYHVEAIATRLSDDDVVMVAKAIKELNALCRKRGMTLIVMLIPEKEQMYRDWIPARYHTPENPLPPSSIGAIEVALRDAGVHVVNLIPVFNEATAQGKRVYWRDDTHWKPEGISMAAAEVWRVMRDTGSGIPVEGSGNRR